MKRFALLLVLMSACDPGPLEITGLKCNDARPCGAGYVCVSEVCYREGEVPEEDAGTDAGIPDAGVDAGEDAGTEDAGVDAGPPDAGPPDAGIPRGVNLLVNPSFEQAFVDGGVVGWRASTGRFRSVSDAGHTGLRAGRLESTGSQQAPVLIPNADVRGSELGMLFCASVWLRAETDAGVDFTLAIRDRFFDGGTSTSSGTRGTVRTSWLQLKEEFATIGTSTIQFRLTANSRFDGGEGIVVDDVWLSRADTSGCP